jgi:hypothetical protein
MSVVMGLEIGTQQYKVVAHHVCDPHERDDIGVITQRPDPVRKEIRDFSLADVPTSLFQTWNASTSLHTRPASRHDLPNNTANHPILTASVAICLGLWKYLGPPDI